MVAFHLELLGNLHHCVYPYFLLVRLVGTVVALVENKFSQLVLLGAKLVGVLVTWALMFEVGTVDERAVNGIYGV